MKSFSLADLEGLDTRYRATLVNSLTGFKSLCLVGTADRGGLPNLAPFSQVFHLGASPPLIGMIVRPDSARRHTLENLLDSGAYTLNHVTAETFRQAHQCSARYPAEVSEFEATGLAPHWEPGFQAPFVQEARIRLAMSLQERHDLAINGTILIIGRIEQAWLPEDCLGPDGFVDLEQAGTVASSGLDSYHLTQRLGRLPYAKP